LSGEIPLTRSAKKDGFPGPMRNLTPVASGDERARRPALLDPIPIPRLQRVSGDAACRIGPVDGHARKAGGSEAEVEGVLVLDAVVPVAPSHLLHLDAIAELHLHPRADGHPIRIRASPQI